MKKGTLKSVSDNGTGIQDMMRARFGKRRTQSLKGLDGDNTYDGSYRPQKDDCGCSRDGHIQRPQVNPLPPLGYYDKYPNNAGQHEQQWDYPSQNYYPTK